MQRAHLVTASFNDHQSLMDAVKLMDVVICAISGVHILSHHILLQLKLVDAIKEVGNIKRFFPFEFGTDPARMENAMEPGRVTFDDKMVVRKAIEEAGIPFTYVSANCFVGYFLGGLCQIGHILPSTDFVVLLGDGNQKAIYVDEDDIATYTIKSINDPRTLNKTLYFRPPKNILSQREVVQIWEKLIGKELKISTLSKEEFLERQEFMIEEGLHQAVVLKLSHGAPDLKEETTLAVVWIYLPNLSPNLFAKKSLLSIASAVRTPITIEKATQIKSRPSTTRVKVILDLMEKLPNHIRLQFVDGKSGKLIEVFQEIVYDNLPLYCNYCKHQAHDEDSCRLISKRNQNGKQIDDTIEVASKGTIDSVKYQGDAREILNKKRKVVDVDQSKASSLDRQLVAVTSGKNRSHAMDVGTRHKLMDTSDVEDAENSGQHVLQVETKNATKNWTLVAQKNPTTNRSLSPTSQNNSPCNEKGATGNFYDSEKRQDISNASRDLLCSNNFDALSKTTENQVKLTENDNYLIQEKQVLPPTLNRKLSLEAPVFVPKCVIAKKNESRALVSNTIDLGEDSLDEDEEDMLDICFDRVVRKGDISPRQQRSGSNKSKKKTHGRKHSWDGKMTEDFVPRHIPMR
ncbi:hypothetical protein H5410_021865 [Solanum commersonii]|uniref:(+)-lariciresinol reductase n=1 Tax=Solanum commersonii TaxID=4109 RepID=A0A9J5ZFH8_SOLCO|nr:hypothetical protein H5410_021865 [Solanum commersonii]